MTPETPSPEMLARLRLLGASVMNASDGSNEALFIVLPVGCMPSVWVSRTVGGMHRGRYQQATHGWAVLLPGREDEIFDSLDNALAMACDYLATWGGAP